MRVVSDNAGSFEVITRPLYIHRMHYIQSCWNYIITGDFAFVCFISQTMLALRVMQLFT